MRRLTHLLAVGQPHPRVSELTWGQMRVAPAFAADCWPPILSQVFQDPKELLQGKRSPADFQQQCHVDGKAQWVLRTSPLVFLKDCRRTLAITLGAQKPKAILYMPLACI